jgi:hypothetical protein
VASWPTNDDAKQLPSRAHPRSRSLSPGADRGSRPVGARGSHRCSVRLCASPIAFVAGLTPVPAIAGATRGLLARARTSGSRPNDLVLKGGKLGGVCFDGCRVRPRRVVVAGRRERVTVVGTMFRRRRTPPTRCPASRSADVGRGGAHRRHRRRLRGVSRSGFGGRRPSMIGRMPPVGRVRARCRWCAHRQPRSRRTTRQPADRGR